MLTRISGITYSINATNYIFCLNGLEPTINKTPNNHNKHLSEDHAVALRVRVSPIPYVLVYWFSKF